MFDPSIGRWLQEDPIGFDAGDANLYRYVHNGPTSYTDPSGLDAIADRARADAFRFAQDPNNPLAMQARHLIGPNASVREVAEEIFPILRNRYDRTAHDDAMKYSEMYRRSVENADRAQARQLQLQSQVRDYAREQEETFYFVLRIFNQVIEFGSTTVQPGTGFIFAGIHSASGNNSAAADSLLNTGMAYGLRYLASEGLTAYRTWRVSGAGIRRALTWAERAEFEVFAARCRRLGWVENPHRSGSWGRVIGETFEEYARIDVAEAGMAGFRGRTHIHINRGRDHLPLSSRLPGEQ